MTSEQALGNIDSRGTEGITKSTDLFLMKADFQRCDVCVAVLVHISGWSVLLVLNITVDPGLLPG